MLSSFQKDWLILLEIKWLGQDTSVEFESNMAEEDLGHHITRLNEFHI